MPRALTTGKSRRHIRSSKKKIATVMREFKHGTLHSGKSRTGPVVRKHKQAVAIALSEARRHGFRIPKKPKRNNPHVVRIEGGAIIHDQSGWF